MKRKRTNYVEDINIKNNEIIFKMNFISKNEDSLSYAIYSFEPVKTEYDKNNPIIKFHKTNPLKFIKEFMKNGTYLNDDFYFNIGEFKILSDLYSYYENGNYLYQKFKNKINNFNIDGYFFTKKLKYLESIYQDLYKNPNFHIPKLDINFKISDLKKSNYNYTFETRNPSFSNNLKIFFNSKFKDFFSQELQNCKGLSNIKLTNKEIENFYFYSIYSNFFIEANNSKLVGELISYGKGAKKFQSKNSVIFEFFERYYSLYSDYLIGNYKNNKLIKKESIKNPDETLLDRFYHNKTALKYPNKYLLDEKTKKLVPFEIVYWLSFHGYNFYDLSTGRFYNPYNTTGLSSGISEKSTKLQGLLEVLEHAFINKNRFKEFTLSYKSIKNKKISSFFKTYNPIIRYYDNPLGVPVFSVRYGNLSGGGTHLNGSIALTRATLELMANINQDKKRNNEIHNNNLENLLEKEVDIEKYIQNYSTGNDIKDLSLLESLLEKNKIPPIYVNLSNKNSEIYVYKTLVPELFVENS